METFDLLMQGFSIALEPLNLALVVFGCALGLFIGAMPGLGSVNGVAILLPMIHPIAHQNGNRNLLNHLLLQG